MRLGRARGKADQKARRTAEVPNPKETQSAVHAGELIGWTDLQPVLLLVIGLPVWPRGPSVRLAIWNFELVCLAKRDRDFARAHGYAKLRSADDEKKKQKQFVCFKLRCNIPD